MGNRYLMLSPPGQGRKGIEELGSGDTIVVGATLAAAIATAVATQSGLTGAFQPLAAAMSAGAGAGITGGTGTVYKTSVQKVGDLYITQIFIDLTGLRSTADGDIIGIDGTAEKCHIGQFLTAESGTPQAAWVDCYEAPVGGDADINLFKATVDTGVEDDAISGLTGQGALLDYAGDFAVEVRKDLTALPADEDYLYLVAGATTDADYSAGKLRITIIGT